MANLELEATISANQVNRLLADLRSNAEGIAKNINDAFGGTVTKKIVFETQADENGAKRLVAVEKERLSVTDKIITAQRKLDSVQSNSVTSLRQQVNTLKQQRDGIEKYVTSTTAAGKSVTILNQEWAKVNSKLIGVTRNLDIASASGFWERAKVGLQLQGLVSFSNGLVQITQGLQAASIIVGQFSAGINNLINTAADLQQFALAFKAIGAGAAGGTRGLQESSRIALGLGVNIDNVQEAFRQLSPVILSSGGSISDVSKVVESLSSRFAAFGISGDKARRVTNGIIQAFAKGKLQAEELTQQISEADPAFKTDLAQALKTAGLATKGTTAELESLVKAGKITSAELVKLIPLLSKSELLFGKLGPTARSAVSALERNAVTIDQVRANIENLNKLSLRNVATIAQPLINSLLKAQAVVADFFSRFSKSKSVEVLINLFERIIQAGTRLLDTFLTLVDGILTVTDAISPIISLFLKIPGAVEIAGIAILSKFIKPLDLLKNRFGTTAIAQNNFIKNLSSGWQKADKSIIDFGGKLADLQSGLRKKSEPISITSVRSSLESFATGADASNTKVQNSISESIAKVQRLKDRIKLLELKPTLAKQFEALSTASAELPTTNLGNFSNSFKRVIQAVDAYRSSISGASQTTAGATRGMDASIKTTRGILRDWTLEAGVFRDEMDRPYGKGISKQFMQDIKVLTQTDPSASIIALQGALQAVQMESKRATKYHTEFMDKVREPYKAGLREQATQLKVLLKQALTGSSKEERGIIQDRISTYKGLQDEYDATSRKVKDLEERLSKSPRDGLSKKAAADLDVLKQALGSARKELAQLSSQFQATSAGIQKVDIKSVKSDSSVKSIEEYTSAVRKRQLLEAISSSEAITDYDKRIKKLKDTLDVYKQLEKSTPGGLTDIQSKSLDKVRTNLAGVKKERIEEIRAIRSQVQEQTNLDSLYTKATSSSARFGDKQKYLAAASSVVSFAFQDISSEIDKNQRKIQRFSALRKKLQKGLLESVPGSEQNERYRKTLGRVDERISGLKDNLKQSLVPAQQRVRVTAEQLLLQFQDLDKKAPVKGIGDLVGKLKSLGAVSFGNVFKSLGAGLQELKAGASGLMAEIGPLPVIFLTIGTLTRAYSDFNAKAASTTADFADQVKFLNAAISDLNPAAQESTANSSALDNLWRTLGAATANVADIIFAASEKIAGAVTKILSHIKELTKGLPDFVVPAVAIGSFGALGAAIGSVFSPLGTLIGAIAGGSVGAFLSFAAANDQTSIALQQTRRETDAIYNGFQQTIPLVNKLTAELRGMIDAQGKISGGRAGQKQFDAGLEALGTQIDNQKKKYDELDKATQGVEGNYENQKTKLTELRAKLESAVASFEKLNAEARSTPRRIGGFVMSKEETNIKNQRQAIQSLREEIARLEEKTIKQGVAAIDLAAKRDKVSAALTKEKQEYDKLAKATGAVQFAQENLLNSTDKLATRIKELQDIAANQDLTSNLGLQRLDEALTKASDLKEVLDLVSKTKREVSLEIKDLDTSVLKAQTVIDIEPGPLRDIKTLALDLEQKLNVAQSNFLNSARLWKQAAAEGTVSTQKAAEGIRIAATEFLSSTRQGASVLVDAIRTYKDQLSQAQTSLSSLKLDNSGFFTREELQANAKEIETRYNAALEKVRRQTGRTDFFPDIAGGTAEETLKNKLRFVEVRDQADSLQKSIKNINTSLDIAVKLLAKIAGVDATALEAISGNVKDNVDTAISGLKKLDGAKIPGIQSLFSNTITSGKQLGKVLGEIEANGTKTILFYENATGKTLELSQAQYNAIANTRLLGSGVEGAMGSAAQSAARAVQEVDRLSSGLISIDKTTGRYAINARSTSSNSIRAVGPSPGVGVNSARINAADEYSAALQRVIDAERRASISQIEYTMSLSRGGDAIRTSTENLNLSNIELEAARLGLKNAQTEYKNTGAAAIQMGTQSTQAATGAATGLQSLYDDIYTSGSQIQNTYQQVGDALQSALRIDGNQFGKYIKGAAASIGYAAQRSDTFDSNLDSAAASIGYAAQESSATANSLANAAVEAQKIYDAINGLNGLDVNVNVNSIPGRWAGGPTQGGQVYRVNEIGKEGFLSSSGSLSAINRPKNSLWKAPSSGTVIPASIWSTMNLPQSKIAPTGVPVVASNSNNFAHRILKELVGRISSAPQNNGMPDLAAVQANQAIQIGKLSRAVSDLVEKDWSVNVKVRNTGSSAYLEALNHRL